MTSIYKQYHDKITARYIHPAPLKHVRQALIDLNESISNSTLSHDDKTYVWRIVEYARRHIWFREYKDEVKTLFTIAQLSKKQRKKVDQWLSDGEPYSIRQSDVQNQHFIDDRDVTQDDSIGDYNYYS